jgi:hypothetical protein
MTILQDGIDQAIELWPASTTDNASDAMQSLQILVGNLVATGCASVAPSNAFDKAVQRENLVAFVAYRICFDALVSTLRRDPAYTDLEAMTLLRGICFRDATRAMRVSFDARTSILRSYSPQLARVISKEHGNG